MTHDDHDTERALRRALEHRADGITPNDRLERIRAAAAEVGEHGERSRWFTVAAAAAVAAVLAGGAWGLSQEHHDAPPLPATTTSHTGLPQLPTHGTTVPTTPLPSRTGTTAPSPLPTAPPPTPSTTTVPAPTGGTSATSTRAGSPGTSGTSSGPSSPDSPAPSTSPPASGPTDPPPTTTATVPVYFVGGTGGADGVGLYRQFLPAAVPVSASPAETVRAALEIALSPAGKVPGTAYLHLWHGVGVTDVAVGRAAIRVTLSGAGDPGSMTGDETRLAVQQLVWTAQAVVGRGNLPVTFAVADGSTALFGTYPTDATYRRPAEAYEDLAPIWITDPVPGATVAAGTPLTAHGQACVFEATVSWQLRQHGSVVRSGNSLASSACPTRGTWRADLGTLSPGTWTLRVFAASPADGSVAAQVSTTFRVR